MSKRFRLANPKKGISRGITNQLIDPLESLPVVNNPKLIVLPSLLGEDDFHSSSGSTNLCALPSPFSSPSIDSCNR